MVLLGILRDMAPRFSELNEVRVIRERFGDSEGYVTGSRFRDGRWLRKVSLSESPLGAKSFDNWIPADRIEITK